MSDLHDLFSVPPDGGRHMIPVAIQPIGALERSLMAPMLSDPRFRQMFAQGVTRILKDPDAAPIRSLVGGRSLARVVTLIGATSAWEAALRAGPAPCLHCGAVADPADPKVGAAVSANYATTEAALAELDDARALSCPRCAAIDPGAHGLATAFMAAQLELGGGQVIDSSRSPLMQPETISRAGRRREKASAKTRAKVETKAAPGAANPTSAAKDILAKAKVKDTVSMYLPLRVALSAEAIAHFPGDCAVCGRGAGASVRSVAVTPVDIIGQPLDGAASLVFRLCRPCAELPDAEIDNAVLDSSTAREYGLGRMS